MRVCRWVRVRVCVGWFISVYDFTCMHVQTSRELQTRHICIMYMFIYYVYILCIYIMYIYYVYVYMYVYVFVPCLGSDWVILECVVCGI